MINAEERAVRAWRRILRKPDEVALRRGTATLTAQVVRVTYDNVRNTGANEAGGQATERRVVIFGVRGHPTVADTDIRVGDRFARGATVYQVQDVILLPGSVQAFAARAT